MEIQLTDFENAAFAIFTVLLTRVILSYDLNLYIPISKVDDNMTRAHIRNAVLDQKFWFRKNLFPPPRMGSSRQGSTVNSPASTRPVTPVAVEDEYGLFTIDEIMNGTKDRECEFIGLIPLIESYLDTVNVDVVTRCELAGYLRLISKRASGELKTGASWIRDFVGNHPEYNKDSVVGDRVNYDLMKVVERLGSEGITGDGKEIELLGRRG
jgi:glutamate--cysteine ligase catalytic subunit